jgi:hypothetical protein
VDTKVYGASEAARQLHAQATAAAPDLRGQLQALARLGLGMDSQTIETARGLIFTAHGWR